MVVDPTPQPGLPPELAFLTPIDISAVPVDHRTICSLHGVKFASSCDECDVHFPDQVRARQLPAGQVAMGGLSLADVKKMIDDAVKNAVMQERAFQEWKRSSEGQLAAAEAPTSQAKKLRVDAAVKALDAASKNADLDNPDPQVRGAAEQALDAARSELRAAEQDLGA